MAPWKLDKKYNNRFEWRREFRARERDYKKRAGLAGDCDVLLYAKALAVAGGAVVIQGQKSDERTALL